MSLLPKQIQVILNYTSKGRRFYKKEDLKKIYSISDQDYKLLEPYIAISNANEKPENSYETKTYEKHDIKPKIISIGINTADTSEFKQLRGIGIG